MMGFGFQTCLKKKTANEYSPSIGKKTLLCPFISFYAASGDMFKFLIGFIVAYLV